MMTRTLAGPSITASLGCQTRLLYHFDRKFTNSENLLAEMADKFSFEF